MNVERIRDGIGRQIVGAEIVFISSVDSTNRLVRELPPERRTDGLTVFTDFQRSGRGRRGRAWIASAGSSLLCTVVLNPPVTLALSDCVMLAALATGDAVAALTGLEVGIKWPNDLIVNGLKVCGILAEHVGDPTHRSLLLGIGLNVNQPEEEFETAGSATSLRVQSGRPVVREDLAIVLLERLDTWYEVGKSDADRLFSEWSNRLITTRADLTIVEGDRTWEGVGAGVQRDGALLVRDARGRVRPVYAADVSIRLA